MKIIKINSKFWKGKTSHGKNNSNAYIIIEKQKKLFIKDFGTGNLKEF